MSKKGKKLEKRQVVGIIRVNNAGDGFITPEKSAESIFIPNENLHTALHGDSVEVRIIDEKDGEEIGTVEKILSRKKTYHVCTLEKEEGVFFCVPQDEKMYVDIRIPKENLKNAKEGEKVVVEITSWEEKERNPVGSIIQILGKPLSHETEMQAILYEKNLIIDFPKPVMEEAKKVREFLKEESVAKRRDFRGIPTCTIDPEDAKDFDDALSVETLPDGTFSVGVHIADVSFFVRPETALDKEAIKRATSIYLVDRTIPMLPPDLSNDLCSLNPNEDKLAYSAIFTLDINGNIKNEWFGRTIIHSKKRFSYEEAQDVLNGKQYVFSEELKTLNHIAHALRKKKFAGGAIDFKDTEVKFVLDEKMHPVSIKRKERLDTHMLVEDFMLLANKRVTEHVEKLAKESNVAKEFVYRVHDTPDPEKIQGLLYLLKSLGYDIKISSPVKSADINKILKMVHGKPEESLIHRAAIKSMQKAVYTTKNIGHFGLAFPFYTHFTSPIRRYPDIIVHRLLEKHLQKEKIKPEEWESYGSLAEHSSKMEKLAEEAERESIKYKQVEYMKDRVGGVFDGIISSVTRWGIYVEEVNTKAEGLVGIRTLPDDYYEFDEKHYALRGKRAGRKLQLGDKVKVKVAKANLSKKQIDYVLV
jgi:ribonuclease R